MGKRKTYPGRRLGREGKYDPLIQVESEELDERLSRSDVDELLAVDLADEIEYNANQARETLEGAGLPTVFHRPCRRQDGKLCATLEGLLDDAKENLEGVWWAGMILEQTENVERFINEGKAAQAARSAMLLQHLIDLRDFRKWELPARAGERLLKTAAYTDGDRRAWESKADELRRENPEIKVREIARQISADTGHKFDAIRGHVNHYLNHKENIG